MTEESKRILLEYMSGKIKDTCGEDIPEFTNLNIKTNNLETLLQEKNINFSITSFAESSKTSNILLYGDNSKGGIGYGVIIILDSEFNVLDIIENFNSGTRFRSFVCLDFDEEGNCYGIDNTEDVNEPNKFRFILLNNFLLKLGDKYQVVLRNSYYFPDEYNSMFFTNPNNTNKIMKKDLSNAYYSFFERNNDTLSGRLIILKIKVGEENEWKKYDFEEVINPELFDYSITFLEEGINTNFFVIQSNILYSLTNEGDIIKKVNEKDLGDISFAQTIEKINDEKCYLTTSLMMEDEKYETKILLYDQGNVFEIFSQIKKSAYLSNICRLIKKDNDIFVIRYDFRNDPDKYYNVDFYTGIVIDKKYYEKYLGFFELNSYSAGNLFVKKEFNLFHICVQDLNNIRYSSLIYNDLNYNGKSCTKPNSLVANSGILYQDDKPVFARNLYNKSINNNMTTSTIEIPNTYLNDIQVNKEELRSKTNTPLVEKSEQIIKNEYENVFVNFLNIINMRNENDPQKIINNPIGATRVNNSINLEDDVENTKITKCKIIYENGKEFTKNITIDLANNTVTDSNPTLTNSLNKKINYLKVEGKTVQNGTPTPDTPIEIQNVKGYRNLLDETLINKSDNTYWVTDKISGINIQANKDYYFTTNTSMSVIRVLELGTDKVIKEVTDTIELIFNVENATKVYFTIYKAESIPTDTKILFIKGNTQRPYVPYGSNYLELKAYFEDKENSTLVNLQNNEICEGDTLIVRNGYASIDKNKAIIELDENSGFIFNSSGSTTEYKRFDAIILKNHKSTDGFDLLSSHFISGINKEGTIRSGTGQYSETVVICMPKEYDTLDKFKQFLKDQKAKGTPVIVQYELANKENIGLGLQEQLTAYNNVTYVSCDDDLQPNLEVNYLINENYSTLSTTIYVDELLKELQFISNDEKTVYQTIDISNLQVGNYYTINQRMEVK